MLNIGTLTLDEVVEFSNQITLEYGENTTEAFITSLLEDMHHLLDSKKYSAKYFTLKY